VKTLAAILAGLVVLCCVSTQSRAQATAGEEARNLQTVIEALEADIRELRLLSERIDEAGEKDGAALAFRRNERSFRLLADVDALIIQVTQLPEGASYREEVERQLGTDIEGIGSAVFGRLNEIEHKITLYTKELDTLSGSTLVSMQAYIRSLESVRLRYYEALVNHFESRTALGLSSEELLKRLEPRLFLHAETLAGKIEFTGAARKEVQNRLNQDPGNADLGTALTNFDDRHQANVAGLESLIALLDGIGVDSSEYKTVMLQHAPSISINFFSTKALLNVLGKGWDAVGSAVSANGPDLLFRMLLFVLVILVFRTLSRIVRRLVLAACDRSSLDMSVLLKNVLVSVSSGTVMALGVLMALSQIGISLAPMLAGLGVAGFIVGFALQDSLGNFAAGAMILIYRPYDVDDFVEITGASGLVKKMSLVSTTIVTFDNQTLVVPNSKIWGDVIKNVTAQTERRVDLVFGIGYGDDIEQAERVLHEIVAAHEKILEEPAPRIVVSSLGDSSVNIAVRPWTKTEDYWDVYWYLTREVKLRFDREGISIPFPQRDVHLISGQQT